MSAPLVLSINIPDQVLNNLNAAFLEKNVKANFEVKKFDHPSFKEPDDKHSFIWRYVNLPKFLDMLQNRTLFFIRADKLREFDKYEGKYLTSFSQKILTKSFEIESSHRASNIEENINKTIHNFNESIFIKRTYINCWHIADNENMAMWKIYSDVFGVCIQSNFINLCNSIIDEDWSYYNLENRVYFGKVEYIDRTQIQISAGNVFNIYLHKSIGYKFEDELRCIVATRPDLNEFEEREYLYINIDLNILINKIYLHPAAPEWYFNNVANLCEQYGFDKNRVTRSNLA